MEPSSSKNPVNSNSKAAVLGPPDKRLCQWKPNFQPRPDPQVQSIPSVPPYAPTWVWSNTTMLTGRHDPAGNLALPAPLPRPDPSTHPPTLAAPRNRWDFEAVAEWEAIQAFL